MHVLVGALVGAGLSVAMAWAVARALGRRVGWRELVVAAAAGAVGGALTTATLGLGAGAASASTTRVVAAWSGGGASAAAVDQGGRNALEGRPVLEGTGQAAAFGASTGVLPLAAKPARAAWAHLRGAGRGGAEPGVARVDGAVADTVRTPGVVGALGGEAGGPAVALRPGAGARGAADDLARGVDDDAARALAGADDDAARALASARGDLAAARSPAARAGLPAVHPPPPAWLEARFAATVAAVRAGRAGPQADPADVAGFLRETYEHVREVDALVRALGGRTRPIPSGAPGPGPGAVAGAGDDVALRGVHDFGERASVRRVEELIASLRREPLRDRDGVPLEVPAWLARLPVEARRAGERSIDVGKLSPHVAAGLSRPGPPDPFAIRLHNLSAHHSAIARPGPAVIEEVADMVQAMRQVRVYRPKPMPFEKIAAILEEHVASGRLPAEARPLIARALEAQARLERSGAVTPYHLLEEAAAPRPALVDLPLGR